MKKLLIVSGSMNRGGAERVISILSNELLQRGWNVSILTILASGCGYTLDPKIKLINIAKDKQNQLLSIPRLSKEIRRVIAEEKPDDVISFMIAVNIVTWIATRGINVRFIPSERNDPSTGRNIVVRFLQNLVYRQSTISVFQTERAKRYFSKRIQDNSIVIPNPISIGTIAKEERSNRIVSVGRLEPQKNQALLIRAFSAVHSKYPNYVLEIYGEGSLRKSLQTLIDTLNLSDYIFLQGNRENIHDLIADAEIFVLSSDFEGQSNALLEAMMMGLPCISTDCSGSDEAIQNNKNGLLVHVGDEAALSKAIEWMIMHPEQAHTMALEGRKSTLRFTKDAVLAQWESIL